MKQTLIYPLALLLTLAVSLTSCDHKELCYSHPHETTLRVVYDWSEAPEANVAGMCAYFYSLDRPGTQYRFDFPGAKGGEVQIAAGRYIVLTYNNDTEAVTFANTGDYENHTALTRTGDILEPLYGNGVHSTAKADNNERVVITPDALYGCSVTQLTVEPAGVTYIYDHHHGPRAATSVESDERVITLYPADMLCHYTFEVRHVSQAGHIKRVSAAITGMAPSLNLLHGTLPAEAVTLPLEAAANANDSTITGHFLTFGHNTGNTDRMSFFAIMDDGSKYRVDSQDNLDVTSQVDTAPDKRHVHIIIDGLNLPKPIDSGGEGFSPVVGDWTVVEEDLVM